MPKKQPLPAFLPPYHERLWVRVTGICRDGTYRGRPLNRGVRFPVGYGEEVRFRQRDIWQVRPPPDLMNRVVGWLLAKFGRPC